MLGKALCFKYEIEDDTINSFISNPPSVSQQVAQILDSIMREPSQQILDKGPSFEIIPSVLSHKRIPLEIEHGKTLNIIPNLSPL